MPGEIVAVQVGEETTVLLDTAADAPVRLDRRSVATLAPLKGRTLAAISINFREHPAARRIEVFAGRLPAILDLISIESQKLLAELLEMSRVVEQGLPRLRGPFWYLDQGQPRRLADPRTVVTFVLDHAGRIQDLVRQLEDDPVLATAMKRPLGPPGGVADADATRSLLRKHPSLLLEFPGAPIKVGGRSLGPVLVRRTRPVQHPDTVEHRRLKAFLRRVWTDTGMSERALSGFVGGVSEDLVVAKTSLSTAAASSLFVDVRDGLDTETQLEPTATERVDSRYGELHALRLSYLRDTVAASDSGALQRLHLARSDEIFQAFCAYLVAESLGLGLVGSDLAHPSREGVAFEGDEWELIHDRQSHLVSWRDAPTAIPDFYRPDILLRRKDHPERVILLDAKHSAVDHELPPGQQIKEVQAYMQSFSLPTVGVLYPGPVTSFGAGVYRDIEGEGYRIRCLPVRPIEGAGLASALAQLAVNLRGLETTPSAPWAKL